MYVRSKILLLVFISLMMIFFVIAVVIGGADFLGRVRIRHNTYEQLFHDVYNLKILTDDYVLRDKQRALLQWGFVYRRIEIHIYRLMESEGTKPLFTRLMDNKNVMEKLFFKINSNKRVLSREKIALEEKEDIKALTDSLLNRLNVVSLSMVSYCRRLSSESSNAMIRNQELSEGFSVAVVLIFMGLVVLISIIIIRGVLDPLSRFQSETEAFGRGELGHRITGFKDDEIGALAKAFNRMGQNLQLTTTSRNSLNREIVRKKRVEEELEASNRMLQLILDNIPVRVFWKDRDSRYLGCNLHFARDVGLSSCEEIFGKDDFQLSWSLTAFKQREVERLIMLSGRSKLNQEEQLEDLSGAALWLKMSRIPLFDKDGNVYGLLGCYEDITAAKTVEAKLERARDEAEKANRMKSEFLANISHEIRTPLNAILGFSDILSRSITGGKELGFLETIKKAGNNLLQLIGDILDLSRIEAGVMLMEKRNIFLEDLFKEVEELFRFKAEEKGLELSCSLPAMPAIFVDPVRLRQVLLNLVGNSFKFTSRGYIRLTGDYRELSGGRLSLEIVVTDSGIGIREEDKETIFEAFRQQSGQSNRKYGGTGLGLAICRKLVMAMGGYITLESEVGKGSVFTILFPDMEKASSGREMEVESELPEVIAFEPSRALIIDSIPSHRDVLEPFLLHGGITSFVLDKDNCSPGKLKDIHPDLIFVCCSPGQEMDYLQFLKKKQTRSSIPIVGVLPMNQEKPEFSFDHVLYRPFSLRQLNEVLIKILPLRGSRQKDPLLPVWNSEDLSQEIELVSILTREILPLTEKFKGPKRMKDILLFAQRLMDLGAQYRFSPLVVLGERLLQDVNSFDISRIGRDMEYLSSHIHRISK